MFRLVYVSSATQLFSKTDLLDLLVKAREKNHRLGITGMLLYKDGDFMQALEGEEAVVRELFARVERDPRHDGIVVLLEEVVLQQDDNAEERIFPEWSMGFRNFADADIQNIEGINKFMNYGFHDDSYLKNPSVCWDLLNIFRNTR
jgi:Sensors of blue-light using FAD